MIQRLVVVLTLLVVAAISSGCASLDLEAGDYSLSKIGIGGGGGSWNDKKAKEIGLVDPRAPLPDADTTQYYLSLHNISMERDGEVYSYPIEFSPGRVVYMQVTPLITSRSVTSAEMFAVKDGFGVTLTLDGRGALIWTQMSGAYRAETLALMIDSKFRSFVQIEKFSTRSTITLDGPFTREEAEGILNFASYNTGRNWGDKIN